MSIERTYPMLTSMVVSYQHVPGKAVTMFGNTKRIPTSWVFTLKSVATYQNRLFKTNDRLLAGKLIAAYNGGWPV